MSGLNNSVIIYEPSPRTSIRRKIPLGTKKTQKRAKRTFYESPLRHIQLSSKRCEQVQAQKRLIRDTKKALKNKKKRPFTVLKDDSHQDSVIILSDNESELNAKEHQNKNEKQRMAKKRPLRVSKRNKQVSNSLCTSNESLIERKADGEPCRKRRRKKSIVIPSDNTSCLLLSDVEDSDASTVDLDDENIAPESESVNQGSDDIVVVWSSTKVPLSSGDQSKEETINKVKNNRLFMIDCNPDPKNLSCLSSTNEVISESSSETVKKVDAEKEKKDPNYLPFSKERLKFPKAHNIGKKIEMKKQKTKNRMKKLRNQASTFAAAHSIPVICNLRVTSGLCTAHEASTSEVSTSEPYKSTDLSTAGPSESAPPNRLREIIIDGNNIAMAHTNGKSFSERGLLLVIDYFKQRGHSVKAFVPHRRRTLAYPLLEKLYTAGIVVFTPSRSVAGRWITPYDDRYILEYATMCGGIVISLDHFRDLYLEKPEWRDTIENRLLAPTFVGDYVMFPEDPLGRNGPKLEEFLRH